MLRLCSNLVCFFFMTCTIFLSNIFSTMHKPLHLKKFFQLISSHSCRPLDLEKFFEQNFPTSAPGPLTQKIFFYKKIYPLCPRPLDLEKNFDDKFLQFAPCSFRKFLPHYSVKKRPYPISKSLRLKKSSPLSASICFKRGHIKQQCRPYQPSLPAAIKKGRVGPFT